MGEALLSAQFYSAPRNEQHCLGIPAGNGQSRLATASSETLFSVEATNDGAEREIRPLQEFIHKQLQKFV